MKNFLLVPLLKLLIEFSRRSRLGAGSTWPGHLMLGANPSFLRQFNRDFDGKIIVIAGTNGKTTTSKMVRTILETNGKKVIHNEAGANLLNGIASSIVLHSSILSTQDYKYAVFEIDENSLPLFLEELTPDVLIVLNLFRDQLDRYGEVNTIAKKWQEALAKLPQNVQVLLNADDPQVAYLGSNLNARVSYFGIEDKKHYLAARPHAMDATFCPRCGKRLVFSGIYLGHLGKWHCASCGLKRPEVKSLPTKSVLPGLYNLYNTKAAVLVGKTLGIDEKTIDAAMQGFAPAFGRQEEFLVGSRKVKIFLSKNPTGFNESLRTIGALGGKQFLLVLNDRIPDGRDVSWIWDVDFEEIADSRGSIHVAGDRVYDLAVRLKYANIPLQQSQIHAGLKEGMKRALEELRDGETVYILPTYSAMLEVRKVLTGRKIL